MKRAGVVLVMAGLLFGAGCGGGAEQSSTSVAVSQPQVATTASAAPATSASAAPATSASASATPASAAPATTDFVAMCPYDDGSGVIVNLPCTDPRVSGSPTAVPSAASSITCDTPCTTSGCEQYQESVLNC